MRTIRASELGSFLYCQRAWWYGHQGIESENQAELAAGTRLHREHSRRVLTASFLRLIASLILLAALVLLTIYLTRIWLH